MMRKFAVVTALVAGLGLAACGGDDDDAAGDGGGGSSQDQVYDMFVEIMEEGLASEMPEGVDLSIEDVIDQDCLREKIDELSDEDAEKLVDAGVDGNPELSAEGEEIGSSITEECINEEAITEALTETTGG